MKKLLLTLFAIVQVISLQAQDYPILVSPHWLHDHQTDANLVVFKSIL